MCGLGIATTSIKNSLIIRQVKADICMIKLLKDFPKPVQLQR